MCHFSLIILLLVSSTPFTARFEERKGEVEKLLFVRQSGKEFTTRVVDSFSRVALFVEREREREFHFRFSFGANRHVGKFLIFSFYCTLTYFFKKRCCS